MACKILQHLFVGDITHKMTSRLLVNHTNMCASLAEGLGNATPYTLCATRHDSYFIFEIHIQCGI